MSARSVWHVYGTGNLLAFARLCARILNQLVFTVPLKVIEWPMLWTVAQVAEFLQCSTCWVYRHKGELPLVRIGGMIRFDSVRLQEMVSSQPPVATLTRTVDALYWHKKWGRS
jgi:hypothetical protein